MELKVEYGIPQPGTGIPEFKAQGVTSLRLSDFPSNILPSGGMSNIISPSEMYMVRTCRPTVHTWKTETGKVLSRLNNVRYSFIGHFPWEITMPGIYECGIEYRGIHQGDVVFEVV